jgi:hypothetical protein
MVASQGNFEFAWKTEPAYKLFSDGAVITSEDATDLEDFAEKNKSRFLGRLDRTRPESASTLKRWKAREEFTNKPQLF